MADYSKPKAATKPVATKSVSEAVALAAKLQYDFGDVFYEPVAEITESGWSTYDMEAWARKHEVKRIELDSRSWVKTAHYYSELGEINTKDWFTDKQLCQEAALMMAEELVHKEIADAQHKADKALQEKNKLEAIYKSNDPVGNLEGQNDEALPDTNIYELKDEYNKKLIEAKENQIIPPKPHHHKEEET